MFAAISKLCFTTKHKGKEMTANFDSGALMSKIDAKLKCLDLDTLSRECEFVKRTPRKVKPYEFLLGFFCTVFTQSVSLLNLAFSMGQFINTTISKMGVKKRLTSACTRLVQAVLAAVLSDHLKSSSRIVTGEIFSGFKHVYLNDSTTISLPAILAQFFPGSGNSNGKKTATLKLQVVYEALRERFTHFEIGSFRDNDQKWASHILTIVQAGDLLIRDLGYFVLEVLAKLHEQGVFFLTRLKLNVKIYDEHGIKELHLVKLLKKYGSLDLAITLGQKLKLPVRLVAIPLPEKIAQERRRKAHTNRDRRLNPSKDHLYLMGFNIFITNVDRQTWSAQQIAQVYEIRWRIEIIFKAWKSHFNIMEVPYASATRVESYIYAMLIYITLFQTFFFIPLYEQLYTTEQKHLSLMKLASLLKLINFLATLQTLHFPFNEHNFIQNILYHCPYEKRNKRLSYPQKLAR